MGLIPVSGRSPGVGNSNLLQCSCLGNPMDRVAWRAAVHGVEWAYTHTDLEEVTMMRVVRIACWSCYVLGHTGLHTSRLASQLIPANERVVSCSFNWWKSMRFIQWLPDRVASPVPFIWVTKKKAMACLWAITHRLLENWNKYLCHFCQGIHWPVSSDADKFLLLQTYQ